MKQLRLISLILAILMIAAVAFSCSSDDKEGSDGTTTVKATTTTPKVTTTADTKGDDTLPTIDMTPENPVTGDAFIEWHNSFNVVNGLEPTVTGLPVVWGDGTVTNIFDGKDGLINTDEAGTKLGGGDASGLITLFFEAPDSTLVAYAFVTGGDSGTEHGRTPEAWTLYGSNVAPGVAVDTDWHVLDEVYVSGMEDADATGYGYEIDADKQGTYSYYKVEFTEVLGGDPIRVLQLNEMYLYEAKEN